MTSRSGPRTPKSSPNNTNARLQMADLAEMAGVSISTVSRALSGSSQVSERTRARIESLANKLNYSANAAAQSLRAGQNRTIAVVVPFDAISRESLSDPFFLGLIGGIADALTTSGHDMLLSRIDSAHLDRAADIFASGRAAGIVMIGQWRGHDLLNRMAARGIPIAVWGARLAHQLYATVGSDNDCGGRLATSHLLDMGCRHIAFIGDPELPEVAQRHAGYLLAHRERGLDVDRRLTLVAPFIEQRVRRVLEDHLAAGGPLDGIFAGSDLSAIAAIDTLRARGLRVPEDVAVAGYDDIPVAAHCHPALTTVRQPLDAAGQALVESILAQVAGTPAESRFIRTELVLRESTHRLPAVRR